MALVTTSVVSGPGWSISVRFDNVTLLVSRLQIVNATAFPGTIRLSDGTREVVGVISPNTNRNISVPAAWPWNSDAAGLSVNIRYQ